MRSSLVKQKWSMYDISAGNVEHDLFDSVVVEYNDIQGIIINYYIRREDITMDRLYGEQVNTAYLTAKESKMTYEVTEETIEVSSFGITSTDIVDVAWMPKSTFTRDVSAGYNPKPGDVIQTLWNEKSYEIVNVDAEGSIFQLSKMVWEFILKPYRFSEQSDSAEDISYDIDSTLSEPLTAYSDNEWITNESDDIDLYSDVDSSIYGF